jgi:chemotaxis protein CheC
MKLRSEQLDLLAEWINIGMGQAGSILHDMLQSPISLRVPQVAIADQQTATHHLAEMDADELSAVCMQFGGSYRGTVALMFPSSSAAALLGLLCPIDNADSPDMDAMKSAALTEVGNIILNSVMGSIVNIMQTHLDFQLPFYAEDRPDQILKFMAEVGSETHLIIAKTNFSVERNAVEGCIIALFEISFLAKLGDALEVYLQSV